MIWWFESVAIWILLGAWFLLWMSITNVWVALAAALALGLYGEAYDRAIR